MTWHFDVNNADNNDDAASYIYYLIQAIKAANPTGTAGSGWYVAGSGDGIAAYEAEGQTADSDADGHWDVFTAALGTYDSNTANSWSNNDAWVLLECADTGLQFLISRDSSSSSSSADNLYILLSNTGAFDVTTANATTAPGAAADEVDILGSRGSHDSNGVNFNTYVHAGVQDASVNGYYAFYAVVVEMTSGAVDCTFIFDPVTETIDADGAPYVVIHDSSTFPQGSSGAFKFYRDYGGGSELWISNGTDYGAVNVGQQADGKERHLPVLYGSTSDSTWKGISSVLKFNPGSRDYPDTINLATSDARIYYDGFTLPFAQGVTPQV